MALTNDPTTANAGNANSTFRHGTGVSRVANGANGPSITNALPTANPRKATRAPSSPATTASSTNGDWMNQLEAPTTFITATSRRLLYAATWMVLATSNSAAIAITPAASSDIVCSAVRMLKIRPTSRSWSTMSLIPSTPAYRRLISWNCSGSVSRSRNDSGNDSGRIASTRSGASENSEVNFSYASSVLS